MSKPLWLQDVRQFCGGAGIEIAGWGADTLIVTAKTPDHAKQVASQLEPFGFKPVENDDDAYAGLLTLSRDVAGTRDKIASFDVSRRSLNERLTPLIWGAIAVVFALLPYPETSAQPDCSCATRSFHLLRDSDLGLGA